MFAFAELHSAKTEWMFAFTERRTVQAEWMFPFTEWRTVKAELKDFSTGFESATGSATSVR